MENDTQYDVHVIETETGDIERVLPAGSFRRAEKIEMGLNRQMNHEKYHTEIVERDSGQ